jgi:putative flippase GtrA
MPSEPSASDPRSRSLPALARRLGAPLLIQFVKFGIVGISNTLLTFVVYTLLLKVFGVWYLAASAIGFSVGAVNGFLLNRRWTFSGHVGDALTPVRWTVVQCCGLGINLGLLYLFVHEAAIDKLIAQAFATAAVTLITFTANRAWTFRTHAHVAVSDGGDVAAAAAASAEHGQQGQPRRDAPAVADQARLQQQRSLE